MEASKPAPDLYVSENRLVEKEKGAMKANILKIFSSRIMPLVTKPPQTIANWK